MLFRNPIPNFHKQWCIKLKFRTPIEQGMPFPMLPLLSLYDKWLWYNDMFGPSWPLYTYVYMAEVKLVTRNPIPNFRTQSCITFKLCIPILIRATISIILYRLVLFFRNFESIVYNNISHLIIEYIEDHHTQMWGTGRAKYHCTMLVWEDIYN